MRRATGTLGAGAVTTLVAFMFDAAPLLVVGIGSMLLAAVSSSWVWAAARGVRIERRGLPARVLEGEAVATETDVRGGALGLPGATLLDPLAREPLARPRRGLHRVPQPTLRLSDPFGLASASKQAAGGDQQLLVLPRTEPVRWLAGGGESPDTEARARPFSEPFAAVDIDGLRPYRPGTSASRIHWPAYARGAGLLERRLRTDGDELPLIAIDARGDQASEHLDQAVRAAASLTLSLAKEGGCRVLLPGQRRPMIVEPDLLSWPAVHARLAVIEGGLEAPLPRLAPDARSGDLIYVAAQALERVPASGGRCVLVLPAELATPRRGAASFEVAGCRGFVLGTRAASRAA